MSQDLTTESNAEPFPGVALFVHTAQLTGLEPDTEYSLMVEGQTRRYRFRTMPVTATRPIRFVVGGDMFQHARSLRDLSKVAVGLHPDFVVLGGDLAYSRGTAEPQLVWLDWLCQFKRLLARPDGWLYPILVTIGNHDIETAPPIGSRDRSPQFFALFPMPGFPGYEVVDFGDYLSVFLLDSGHVSPMEGEQTNWLEENLARRAGRCLVPIYHVPAYPARAKIIRGQIARSEKLRRHWTPLFDEHGVVFAFEHHEHIYKRSHPLCDGKVETDGVTYVGGGAWGVAAKRAKKLSEDGLIAYALSRQNIVLTKLDEKGMTVEAIDRAGRVFDTWQASESRVPWTFSNESSSSTNS